MCPLRKQADGRALLRPAARRRGDRGVRQPLGRCDRRWRFARVAHLVCIDSLGVRELELVHRSQEAPAPPPPRGVLGRGSAEPKEKPERLPRTSRCVPRVHARGGLRAPRPDCAHAFGGGVVAAESRCGTRGARLLGDRRPSGTAVGRTCADSDRFHPEESWVSETQWVVGRHTRPLAASFVLAHREGITMRTTLALGRFAMWSTLAPQDRPRFQPRRDIVPHPVVRAPERATSLMRLLRPRAPASHLGA